MNDTYWWLLTVAASAVLLVGVGSVSVAVLVWLDRRYGR